MTGKSTYGWKFRMSVLGGGLLWASAQVWVLCQWFEFPLEVSIYDSFNSTFFTISASFIGVFITEYIPQKSRLSNAQTRMHLNVNALVAVHIKIILFLNIEQNLSTRFGRS